ncbi:MAG: hypothetical protein Tsb002_06090 [Wenzhouxiangellaceae bacterium]
MIGDRNNAKINDLLNVLVVAIADWSCSRTETASRLSHSERENGGLRNAYLKIKPGAIKIMIIRARKPNSIEAP